MIVCEDMVDDKNIYTAAGFLLEQYGESADIATAQVVDDLVEQGDLRRAALWRRIQLAVRELAKTEPEGPLN